MNEMDYLDKAGALYIVTKTKEMVGGKVDQEEGKNFPPMTLQMNCLTN